MERLLSELTTEIIGIRKNQATAADTMKRTLCAFNMLIQRVEKLERGFE
jgi:hypothetical protein